MKVRWHKFIRKSHRYLGVIIGIQFLMWTIGGLYFSWMDLDTVHGTDRLAPAPELSETYQHASLDAVLKGLEVDGIKSVQKVEFHVISTGAAVYRITYENMENEIVSQLFDASNGIKRNELTEEEAQRLARLRYDGKADIISTEFIEAAGAHDEYRELPLPAYAFTFDDPRKTTIYVAPKNARITSLRNNQWRVFDFLWMLHTMDYQGRDNFNNRLLQVFALFGLLTIFSGFSLFFISSRFMRQARR